MGTAADEKHADADELDPPANFTDTYYFPPFSQLQSEHHVGQDLYEDGETWCLLAEIDAASTSAGNPFCLVCHDRSGDSFIVGFDLSKGMRFSPAEFRIGYTVAVVYAKRVSFVDGTKGIRVSDMATCHAFPYKLDRLIEVNKTLVEYWDTLDDEGETKTCHACGREDSELAECDRCKLYYYCNEECQKAGVEAKEHNVDCAILRAANLQSLLRIESRDASEQKLRFIPRQR